MHIACPVREPDDKSSRVNELYNMRIPLLNWNKCSEVVDMRITDACY